MPVPTEELWRNTARRFQEKWNFPNCIAALDGKHVVIQAPANSGSYFYNYKGTFSVVLLTDYRFLAVDAGGSYVIVVDEVFPLKTFILQPYRLPEDHRVFNYRLSRAQRIAENVLGILSQCWLQVCPDTADRIIKATCILTIYLRGADGNHSAEVEDDQISRFQRMEKEAQQAKNTKRETVTSMLQ